MATLTVQSAPGRTGLDLTATAVAASVAGDGFANGANTMLALINGDASSHTVTFTIVKKVDGVSVSAGKAVTVAAGHTALIGPFDAGIYNDANGKVNFTYDAVTSVKVVAFNPV